ncbi:MAG: macro domain-containing protein [Clostridia bacterium]|nr:macro domain-containing protein [Clostridia bacterium]
MPLRIVENDITKISCDAIVNAANSALRPGGGVDGAIHRAAGPGLYEECRKLDGCPTGEARLTGGYRLPAKYVIHTAGPVWQGGGFGEEALLRSCYRSALAIAKDLAIESIAFPLISAGVYRYPKAEALRIAVEEIASFDRENDILVFLVIYDRSSFDIGSELSDSIAAFIESNYRSADAGLFCPEMSSAPQINGMPAEERAENGRREKRALRGTAKKRNAETAASEDYEYVKPLKDAFPSPAGNFAAASFPEYAAETSLEAALAQIDESFSEMLLRKIDEKQMTDVECYKKANIDRKLFSKIRGDRLYRPSKPTAIAFAVALELPLPEAKEMLMKAGYALSRSSRFDIIIEYFISKGNYDINEINEALFAFDQVLLGA